MSHDNRGFTMIELMLAMSTVTILLLAVSATILQLGSMYRKGMAIKYVGQSGQQVSDDIRNTISSSGPLTITPEAGAGDFRLQVRDGGNRKTPDGGRLCVGRYSYVWNLTPTLDNPVNKYTEGAKDNVIRLVKVNDPSGSYCANPTRPIEPSDAQELLSKEGSLSVKQFTITTISGNILPGQAMYNIEIEISAPDKSSEFSFTAQSVGGGS